LGRRNDGVLDSEMPQLFRSASIAVKAFALLGLQ